MTVDTLGRVSCVSKYKDITFKDHKSITKKEGKKLYLKKNKKIKNRKRSRKRGGCNKDYVLVLEADNSHSSCKLSLQNKLTIYLSYMYFGQNVTKVINPSNCTIFKLFNTNIIITSNEHNCYFWSLIAMVE